MGQREEFRPAMGVEAAIEGRHVFVNGMDAEPDAGGDMFDRAGIAFDKLP